MQIVKLTSITKKLVMGALGAFLLIFLPAHMGMNLCIIRSDGGEWYRNVCHFMGTNYIVKIFEVVLLATVLLHIILGIILAIENKLSRPIAYQVPHKTKTEFGSKYMIYTGIIIVCFLILHFTNFYFVKVGLVEGKYVAKMENVDKVFQEKVQKMQKGELSEEQQQEIQTQYQAIQSIPQNKYSKDFKYLVNMSKKDVQTYCGKDFKQYEPDFYQMANDLFKNNMYFLIYMFVFIVLGIHLYHGVGSVFQTFGLNNEKYHKAISTLSLIYAIVIPIGFLIVPLFVMFCR
jgi:succinate dehydrogenase/fumarate reductase cytochrome b subunit (b558 family)